MAPHCQFLFYSNPGVEHPPAGEGGVGDEENGSEAAGPEARFNTPLPRPAVVAFWG